MSDIQEKQSPYPVIHTIECKACGRCVLDCPKHVLELGTILNERGYVYAVYKGEGAADAVIAIIHVRNPMQLKFMFRKKKRRRLKLWQFN